MSFTCCKGKFNRNTYYHMYFKTVEINTFRSTASPILFSLYDFRPSNANIMAYFYRKTVDTIGCCQVQAFSGFSYIKEKFTQRFSYLMQSPVEPAFTKHTGHQACTMDKTKRFFNIPTEILDNNQHDCDNFRIGSFSALCDS